MGLQDLGMDMDVAELGDMGVMVVTVDVVRAVATDGGMVGVGDIKYNIPTIYTVNTHKQHYLILLLMCARNLMIWSC
jgi:hypothetical protein